MNQEDVSIEHPSGLLALPDELLRAILDHISPLDLASIQTTCSRLNIISADTLLWESACLSWFRWWDKNHDFETKRHNSAYHGWKQLFANRWRSHRNAQKALAAMTDSETNRLDRIADILNTGYDAKDVLVDAFRDAPNSDLYLSQRYWSHAILGNLHRYMACEEWAYLKYRPDTPNATERSLAALDMFVLGERSEGDIDDIFTRLNSYVASVREANPDIDNSTPRQKATTVASHLLRNHWTGISDGRNYHSLDHMFLGVALFSDNRNSVPLISAIIYCYVIRQFGLLAQPISYPFHVHALVQPDPATNLDLDNNPLPLTPNAPTNPITTPTPPSPSTHLYIDPFNSADPIPATHLHTQLRFIAPTSTPTQIATYLSPATPRDLTIRAAHNILAAPSHYSGNPLFPLNTNAAAFGALLSLILLPPLAHPAQTTHHLSVVAQHFAIHFDHDVELFAHHVLPVASNLTNAHAYASLVERLRARDATPAMPKRRGGENEIVKYRVGQVFRHRMRGYLAVVYGWDAWCKMDEQWIVQNSVDRLPGGRGQPFYNVLVEDESTRYVAQENVILLTKEELQELGKPEDRFPIEIGMWFKRYDPVRGVFVSNVTEEYPED